MVVVTGLSEEGDQGLCIEIWIHVSFAAS